MHRAAFVLMSLLLTPPAFADAQALVGYAYDRVRGTPLYSEHHVQEFRDGALVAHQVEYRDPDGSVFARKSLQYGAHPYAPEFRLDDTRDGYAEGGRWQGGAYAMFRVLAGRERSETVAADPDLVADAGFDRLVQANLEAFRRGDARKVRLAVPGRLTWVSFVVEPASRAENEIVLRARPTSLLRLVVEPIHLTYDENTGRLRRYVGISNIRSSSGDRHDTRIEFPLDGQRPADFGD